MLRFENSRLIDKLGVFSIVHVLYLYGINPLPFNRRVVPKNILNNSQIVHFISKPVQLAPLL
jgi:hypothetical protein